MNVRLCSCALTLLLTPCALAQTPPASPVPATASGVLAAPGIAAPGIAAPGIAAPSIDRSLEMTSVGSPAISPDGTRVVYQQTRTDWDSNAFENDLWIASTTNPKPHRLTALAKSATNARWSPDGTWIAFLSNRPGTIPKSPADKQQIYVAAADGGEAIQLTHVEAGVNSLEWSPDSKSLAFVAPDPETKAQKDRKESFGEYHVIHSDYRMDHLWLVDVPADPALQPPVPVRLTEGAFSVGSFKYSPDGRQIAFAAQRDPDLISAFSGDIYTVTLAGHTVKKIVDTPGPDHDPIWSPDGRQIAFVTSDAAPNFFFSNNRIATVASDGSSKPAVLNGTFDEDAQLAAWTAAGIYFSGYQGTVARLFLLDPNAKTVQPVSPETQLLGQPSISPDGRHLAFRGALPNAMAEVYTTDPGQWAPVKITDSSRQMTAFAGTTREVVSWKSGDGSVIEGVLQKPADFQAGRKYPLLVIIHGGPTGSTCPTPRRTGTTRLSVSWPAVRWCSGRTTAARQAMERSSGL